MFKVYLEDFYYEYEPAEGGQYIRCSNIYLEDEVKSLEEAREKYSSFGDVFENDKYFYNVEGFDSDGYPLNELAISEFTVCNKDFNYIIVDEKKPEPAPKIYLGYR